MAGWKNSEEVGKKKEEEDEEEEEEEMVVVVEVQEEETMVQTTSSREASIEGVRPLQTAQYVRLQKGSRHEHWLGPNILVVLIHRG